MMRISILLLALLGCLSSCSGRLNDRNSTQIDFAQFNLEPGKPALVSFGALWCKPCREEIVSLNRLQVDFPTQIQIVEYLVEGQIEGTPPEARDPDLFFSKSGEVPTFRLDLDPMWRKFHSFQPPKKALPLMIFIDGRGQVQTLIQRSLDYEEELKPWIMRALAGLPPVEPTPAPGLIQRNITYPEWLAESPAHQPGSEIDLNFRAAWLKGIEKFAFDPHEMAFEHASIGEKRQPPEENFQLTSGTWYAGTCRLFVSVAVDGKYIGSQGSCD